MSMYLSCLVYLQARFALRLHAFNFNKSTWELSRASRLPPFCSSVGMMHPIPTLAVILSEWVVGGWGCATKNIHNTVLAKLLLWVNQRGGWWFCVRFTPAATDDLSRSFVVAFGNTGLCCQTIMAMMTITVWCTTNTMWGEEDGTMEWTIELEIILKFSNQE